jgi:hypothetical protein
VVILESMLVPMALQDCSCQSCHFRQDSALALYRLSEAALERAAVPLLAVEAHHRQQAYRIAHDVRACEQAQNGARNSICCSASAMAMVLPSTQP